MRRGKKIEYREQTYDIGNDATVTVRYRADKRPQMMHNDTEVVVRTGAAPTYQPATFFRSQEPETNGPDYDTPEILAMKQNLPKRVVTSEDVMRQAGVEGFDADALMNSVGGDGIGG